MASSVTIRTGEHSSDPHIVKNEPSKGKTISFAIVIILGLGGLAVAGVGFTGFFSNLNQANSIIAMTIGGGGGIVFLIIGIIGCVRNHQTNNHQQNKGKEHSSTVISRTKNAAIIASNNAQDDVKDGFSVSDEADSTQKASSKKDLNQPRDGAILKKDSQLIVGQEFPKDAKKVLDAIFIKPLPPKTSAIQALYNHAGPDDFIKHGDSIIFPLKNTEYLIKMQGNEDIFYCQHNLQRVVMNVKIQDCILKYNLEHFTTIKKYIYLLPQTNDQELNDTTAVVIAKKIEPVNINIEELSDEQYEELLIVVKTIKYADLRSPNLTWIYEDGKKKMAILDTEDIASKFADRKIEYYLEPFYRQFGTDEDVYSITKIAQELLKTDPEISKQILKLCLSYYRGVLRLKPKDVQVNRQVVFAKAVAEIENELQEIIKDFKPSFKVKLSS